MSAIKNKQPPQNMPTIKETIDDLRKRYNSSLQNSPWWCITGSYYDEDLNKIKTGVFFGTHIEIHAYLVLRELKKAIKNSNPQAASLASFSLQTTEYHPFVDKPTFQLKLYLEKIESNKKAKQ